MTTWETCSCNYVGSDQHRIILTPSVADGTIRSFVCQTHNLYCPSLYQYVDGELTLITTLPSQESGGAYKASENYRTVQFSEGVWTLMDDASPIYIGVD